MPRNQRVALVTGANKGIGFEVVRQLARERFRVFLGARNTKAGEAAAAKFNKEGGREHYAEVCFIEIDISQRDSIARAAEEFSKHSDRLDVLVNNAGILRDDDESVLAITPDIFETTLRTNT